MPSKDLVKIKKMMVEQERTFTDHQINSVLCIGIIESTFADDILFVSSRIVATWDSFKYVIRRSDPEWGDLVEFNSYLKRVLSL